MDGWPIDGFLYIIYCIIINRCTILFWLD